MGRPVQVAKRRRPRRVRLSMPYRGDPLAVKAPAHTNVEKRERGDPAFRPAGQQRLNARERVFADLALAMLRNIPPGAIERYAVDQDDGALAMATALAVAPYEPLIAEALLEQFDESGVNASDEWRREISRAWARVGKEELPDWLSGVPDAPKKPSTVALEYRFDRASPTATKWATNEAASLVTDITYQQSKAMREVVTRAFTEGRTYGQTASALGQILQQVNPTGDVGQMLASQYAINANGLTPMYANAVARSAQGHAEALLAQGVTGTKALEAVQKKGQRYADKLRRSRAKMISRTEIMRASNQGRLEAANQAAKKGLIDPAAARRQWMASPMDACPICTDLNGAIVALNQSWYAGEPPAHPSCRCTWLLVPNVNVQAPPAFGGAGTGSDPFKWSFPAPMKVGDDFLPGAPLVEPVPSTVPSAHDAMKESLLGQLEDGLVTVDEVVEAQLAQAGNDAFLAGKRPVSVLEDALVTLDDGTVVMDLGRVIDLDSLPAVEAMPYRMLILPPRLASLVDAPSPSWKPWEPLLHAVKNDYVQRGYLDVDTAGDLAAAIRTLRDAALAEAGLTAGALPATDLLDFWRALVRLSDNLDNRVRAAIKAGAKPPQGGSTLAKWLKRQAKIVNTLNAADDTAAAFATALEGQIVSWFGAGTDWVLPKVKVFDHAVTEPGWWSQEMTPGQKWSVGLKTDDPARSLAYKFGEWDDLSDGAKKVLATATEDEHIKNLITHLESTGVLTAGGGPPPSMFAAVAEPPWWKGKGVDKVHGKWDDIPPQAQQALLAVDHDDLMGGQLINDILTQAGVSPAVGFAEPAWWKGLDFESKHGKWGDLGPGPQQDLLDLTTDNVDWHLNVTAFTEAVEDITDLLPPAPVAAGEAFAEGTAAAKQHFDDYFGGLTADEVGKWSTAILDPATGTTAVGRARLSNLVGTVGPATPGIYDDVVLPLGMRGFDAGDFLIARANILKLADDGLMTPGDAAKFIEALGHPENGVSKVGELFMQGDRLVALLQGATKISAQLHEAMSMWTGSVGVEVLGKGTRLRKWYDAFTNSLKHHADDIDNVKIAQSNLGELIDAALPWLDELGEAGGVAPGAPAPPSAAKPKKPPPVEAKPLTDWEKPSMPDEPPFDPKRLIEDTGATASLGGQHPKRVFTDPDTGQQWIFKPQPQWRAEADRATAELQRRLGLQGAETYVVKVDGQIGSIQQALGGELADTAPIFGGKAFDATKLSSAQMGRMQQNQLLDFLFSNYDAHSDNFLRLRQAADPAMLPIGIDKGQAFKHFGKAGESDGLVNWLFNPNNNAPARNPYGVMLQQVAGGEAVAYNWAADSLELQQFIVTVRQLADSGELAKILRPYAEEAFAAGTLPAKSVDEFIEAVVARWRGLGDEVARLEEKLLQTAGGVRRLEQLALAERVADLALKDTSEFGVVTTAWSRDNLKAATDALTESQRAAVQRYTGSYYQELNKALRDAKGIKSQTLSATDARNIKNLDAAMKPLGHDITVHRGTNHISLPDGSILDPSQAQGKILGDFGYQSSSVGGNAAFGGNVSLEIHVDASVRAVYAQPISTHSGEREILLQRGLRMYVEKAEKRGGTWHLVVKAIPDTTAVSGLSEPMVLPIYKEAQLWQMMKAS